MEETTYTMRQVSKMLGVSSQKLRRYCNRGFVPGLRQPVLGASRVFTEEQVSALRTAHFLTMAGFTTQELRKYVRFGMSEKADEKLQQLAMLRTHKRQVWQELEDRQATIDFIERQEELLEA